MVLPSISKTETGILWGDVLIFGTIYILLMTLPASKNIACLKGEPQKIILLLLPRQCIIRETRRII